MFYGMAFPGKKQNTCLCTPDKESKTDHNTETTKYNLVNQMSFIVVIYRSMDGGVLKGSEMT